MRKAEYSIKHQRRERQKYQKFLHIFSIPFLDMNILLEPILKNKEWIFVARN